MLERGVLDFAGGGAVHGVGGAAAFMGAYFLGPRIGRFSQDENGKWTSTKIPGHNMVLSALGVFMLWVGFFAFNGGSGKYRTNSELPFSGWTGGFLTQSLIPLL
jgi:Amt family ammonium transporter